MIGKLIGTPYYLAITFAIMVMEYIACALMFGSGVGVAFYAFEMFFPNTFAPMFALVGYTGTPFSVGAILGIGIGTFSSFNPVTMAFNKAGD